MAKSVAEHVGSTFAEAEGTCEGNPLVQAGIDGQDREHARLLLGQVGRHQRPARLRRGRPVRVFVPHPIHRERPAGALACSGLASMGQSNAGAASPPRIEGVVPAIVVDNNDPNSEGTSSPRVPVVGRQLRVRLVSRHASRDGQEGRVDAHLRSPTTRCSSRSSSATSAGRTSSAGCRIRRTRRRFRSPASPWARSRSAASYSRDGHKLVFTEDPTPDPTDAIPKQKTGMRIEDKDGKLKINLDMKQPVGKKIEIQVNGAAGGCTLSMDDMGAITIESTTPGAGQIIAEGANHLDRGATTTSAQGSDGERGEHRARHHQGQPSRAQLTERACTTTTSAPVGRFHCGRTAVAASRSCVASRSSKRRYV